MRSLTLGLENHFNIAIAFLAWLWFKRTLDIPAIIGVALVVAGVVVVNVFSKVAAH